MTEESRVKMVRGHDDHEWPREVKEAFVRLTQLADDHDFSVLCALGLNHKERRISAFFSPHTSANPHLANLCDDVSEMFQKMAKRLRQ